MTGAVTMDRPFDTFPKLLVENARIYSDAPASREKDFGIWLSWTWSEVAGEDRALVCGLAALGLEPGEKVCICGDNRRLLYWALTSVQAAGAIPVPVYQDSVADEPQRILITRAL